MTEWNGSTSGDHGKLSTMLGVSLKAQAFLLGCL
jgi:hypothetical protein